MQKREYIVDITKRKERVREREREIEKESRRLLLQKETCTILQEL